MSKESKFKEDVEAFEKEHTIDKLKDEIDKGHLNKLEKNLASKKVGKMDLNDSSGVLVRFQVFLAGP